MKQRIQNKIQTLAAVLTFILIGSLYARWTTPPAREENLSAFRESSPLSAETVAGLSGEASAIVLYDALTDTVLYEHGGDLRLPMASTTKIMTATVALENGDPDALFSIPASVCGVEGSSIYLRAGETLTLRELLYGLMLESGNDAAEAVAVCVGGTKEHFVSMMNDKAKELGLSSTHFDNPHGLSSETHYTTAKELASLSAYALRNEEFRSIVSCKSYTIPERENCAARYFSNHNRLLRSFPNCTGVKTGYTAASGRCLVTSAEENGGRYVVVTLNDRKDFSDHKTLLRYAAESFSTICAADEEELSFSVRTRRITNPKPLCLTVPNGFDAPISVKITVCRESRRGSKNTAWAEIRAGEYAARYEMRESENRDV